MIVKFEVYVDLREEENPPKEIDVIAGELLDVLIKAGYGHEHEISDPTASDETINSIIAIKVVEDDPDWLEDAVAGSAAIGFPVNS